MESWPREPFPALSKRRLGLGLAAFILLALVALPMLSRLSPAFEAWQATLPLPLSGLLSPGPLSAGHERLAGKCSSCHRQAFRGVADAACTECHQRVAPHLAANDVHAGALGGARCADCHPAHEGKAAAMPAGSAPCLACHRRQDTAVARVRDFATGHPPFRLTVPVGDGLLRLRQGETPMPAEKSGLKYSHQVHLVKEGVSSPDGNTVLLCRDCHKLAKSGGGFAPMTMKDSCQQSRCHRLRFDPPVGGIVPHGSEREVLARLRDFYRQRLAAAPAPIPGKCATAAGNAIQRTLACAEQLAEENAAASLFRQTGEKLQCGLCHDITATGKADLPWRVAPLRRDHRWLATATFAHDRHDTFACTECHDKGQSKSSADISLPTIDKCRQCHAGASKAAGRVKSSCESCHRFHRAEPPR